jgi:hypothetical protein
LLKVARVQVTGPTKFPEKMTPLGSPAALYPAANVPSTLPRSTQLLANAVDARPMESAIDNTNLNGAIIGESSYWNLDWIG